MKLPTKNEIIAGCVLILLGVVILLFLPRFPYAGWNAICLGVAYFLFPGPQLRARYKQTEETQAQWRQRAKDASAKNLNWWSSPVPWGLLIVLLVFFASAI